MVIWRHAMINQNQIVRLLEQNACRPLIERVLENGRCSSEMTRRLLLQAGVAMPVALGLGLQRAVELTYAPTAEAAVIVRRLIAIQAADGMFGEVGATRREG